MWRYYQGPMTFGGDVQSNGVGGLKPDVGACDLGNEDFDDRGMKFALAFELDFDRAGRVLERRVGHSARVDKSHLITANRSIEGARFGCDRSGLRRHWLWRRLGRDAITDHLPLVP